MPSSSSIIPGFVTKKYACRTYKRSHRQLTRDVGAAMATQDERVLRNLMLRTEDGEVRIGTEVTTELISSLRLEGLNPMWYVRAAWMERTFGKRSDPERAHDEGITTQPIEEKTEAVPIPTGPDILVLLRERLQELEKDKIELRGELKIKNEQIREANEREKETNILMRDLHELMMDMQRRLLPPPRELNPTTEQVASEQQSNTETAELGQDAVIVHTEKQCLRKESDIPKEATSTASVKETARTSNRQSAVKTRKQVQRPAESQHKRKRNVARQGTKVRSESKGSPKQRTSVSRKKRLRPPKKSTNVPTKPARKIHSMFSRLRSPFFPR
jgi:hypothetical protein